MRPVCGVVWSLRGLAGGWLFGPFAGRLLAPVGLVGRGCFAPVVGPGWSGLTPQLPPQIGGRIVSNMGANMGAGWFGGVWPRFI